MQDNDNDINLYVHPSTAAQETFKQSLRHVAQYENVELEDLTTGQLTLGFGTPGNAHLGTVHDMMDLAEKATKIPRCVWLPEPIAVAIYCSGESFTMSRL